MVDISTYLKVALFSGLIGIILFTTGCVSKDEYEKAIQEKNILAGEKQNLQQQYKRLEEDSKNIQTNYSRGMKLLNRVEDNFTKIETYRNGIYRAFQDIDNSPNMAQDLREITDLRRQEGEALDDSKRFMNELRKIDAEYAMFGTIVENLSKRIVAKEKEIQELKSIIEDLKRTNLQLQAQVDFDLADYTENVATMTNRIDSLNEENKYLSQNYDSLKNDLFRSTLENDSIKAYSEFLQDSIMNISSKMALMEECNLGYIIAKTQKELKELGILDGKNLADGYLNNIELFSDRDMLELDLLREIPFNDSKGIKNILPERAPDSYDIKKNYLYIYNPSQFWRTSKYLIVVLK